MAKAAYKTVPGRRDKSLLPGLYIWVKIINQD